MPAPPEKSWIVRLPAPLPLLTTPEMVSVTPLASIALPFAPMLSLKLLAKVRVLTPSVKNCASSRVTVPVPTELLLVTCTAAPTTFVPPL